MHFFAWTGTINITNVDLFCDIFCNEELFSPVVAVALYDPSRGIVFN